jgi:transcriptional regulator
MQKMIDGIVAFEVRTTRMQGKFKLSQNRPPADRSNVIAALNRAGSDTALRLAELMEQVLKP